MIEGHLYTEGIVGSDYVDKIRQQIAQLPADADIIIHHIKSPGGNVYAAWKAIPELMKIQKPIKSIIEGEASSIASWIAVIASRVEATNPSTAMIHEPFFPEGIQGSIGVDDLDTAKTELTQIRQAMAEAYAKKSGRPVEEWLKIMKGNTRLTAQMLKAYGLVDDIIEMEPTRIAAVVQDLKNDITVKFDELMGLFKTKAAAVNRPTTQAAVPPPAPPVPPKSMVDCPLADGTILSVDAPNEDSLIGAPATLNGAPAPDGSYPCADGDTITVAGGLVTAVQTASPDSAMQPDVQKTLQKQIQNLEAELAAAKAKEAETVKMKEEEAVKAESEKQKLALEAKEKEVVALAKEVEELKKVPIGDTNKPFQGMNSTPYAVGTTSNDKKLVMATRTFIADQMPWMEKYYKDGKFTDGTTFNSYRSGGPNAVSILETNFNYTWNGILTTDLFFKPTLNTPALSDIFTIDLGASHKKVYNLVPALSNVLQPYFGCTTTPNTDRIQITNTTIQMKEFRMYEGWCKDDFTGQLSGSYNNLAQEWLKTGEASFDPAGTPIDKIIVTQLKDALRRDVFQRASFGAGNSTSTNYNQIDGLWDRLIDSSGASNYCVYRDGTALGTGTLGATVANDRFTSIFNNSNLLLKQEGIDTGEAQFVVTRSIWENYYSYLVAVGSVAEQEYINYLQGIKRLTFRGIPVIPVSFWDQSLADANNPLSATTRHLILFTLKRNHILGVEDTGDLNNITSWYEMKDSKRYYRADMKLGYQYLHCDLQTIAF